jgi:predicted permease
MIGLAGWVPATIFAMGSLITLVTVGGAVALIYGRTYDNQPNYRESLVKLLKFPFFIALIVSIVLRVTLGYIDTNQYPPIIVWKYLGIGVGLVLIGIDCRALTRITLLESSMNRTGIVRFIISPIFAIVVCLLFRFPRLIAIPLIVQAWGPPAIMTILYSDFYGLDTQTTSRNVAVLTFMALLLLPLQIIIIFWLYPA